MITIRHLLTYVLIFISTQVSADAFEPHHALGEHELWRTVVSAMNEPFREQFKGHSYNLATASGRIEAGVSHRIIPELVENPLGVLSGGSVHTLSTGEVEIWFDRFMTVSPIKCYTIDARATLWKPAYGGKPPVVIGDDEPLDVLIVSDPSQERPYKTKRSSKNYGCR